VVTSGISQNWFWWCQAPITMAGVFFFARLWKRANPMTDMEFVYVRYSGGAANFLRGFKAVWLAIPYGGLVMGWVNKAMAMIINLTIPDFPHIPVVDALMLSLFLHTPLSQGMNAEVKAACLRNDIRPLAIAAEYKLLTYNNVQIFSDFENGAYKEKQDVALRRLGLADRLSTGTISGIRGVPKDLLEPKKTAAAKKAGASASAKRDAEVIRPVKLADGTVLDYDKLKRLEGEALAAGQEELEKASGASANSGESAAPEEKKIPLAKMGSVEFLHQIYTIASNVNQYKILFILFLITIAYTFISGLWGVLVTDFVQFWLAMFGCVVMAVLAVRACGGMENMMTRLAGIYSLEKARAMVGMVPTGKAGGLGLMPMSQFFIFILLVWWSVGFTDGGSYFAQRMLSAKDERHAALGYLWFAIAHFALRMWPWIICGIAAAVLFPFVPYANGQMPPNSVAENGYIRVLVEVLPTGFVGLMIAALFAAYMSTIATQVNLGASYLMNDFYRPFIAPKIEKRAGGRKFSDRHYLRIGMAMVLVQAALGIFISLFLNSIADAWFLLASFNAGIGVIYLLRWYWHRINAWSEVTCILSLIYFAIILYWLQGIFPALKLPFPYNLLISMPFSVGMALIVTLLTPPTDHKKLIDFCRRVQPGGPGWRDIEDEIRKTEPGWKPHSPLNGPNVRNWILSIFSIYCFLIGIGKLIIGDTLYPAITAGNAFLGMAAIAVLATFMLRIAGGRAMRPMWLFLAWAILFIAQIACRELFGAAPREFFLNYLYMNRAIGILLTLVGMALGWMVISTFSPRKWTETPAAPSDPASAPAANSVR